MAISIDWENRVIFVPQADLTPLGGAVYQLNVNDFRLALKDLEDGEAGMVFPDTHQHNTEATVAGSTFARLVAIINGYTVEFEDGQYTVTVTGGNHNIGDVKVVNQVSLIVNNSGGLVVGQGAVDAIAIRDAVWNADPSAYGSGTTGDWLNRIRKAVGALLGLA